MKREMGKKRGNPQLNKDAGFSLVELLIAVIILAIIVVPTLRLFVTSARINGKARQSQRATTVAQDIMEGLKAYNIKELQEQFNNPMEGFYVMDSRLILGSIEEDTDMEEHDADRRSDPNAPPGIYYFTMEDIKIQGTEYDALIRIDSRAYEKDKVPGSGHDNAFNDVNMASPGSVAKYKDGNFTESYNFKQAVVEDINTYYAGLHADWDDRVIAAGGVDEHNNPVFSFPVFKRMGGTVKRTITLKLNEGMPDADGNRTLDADITFQYECTYSGESYETYGDSISNTYWVKDFPCGSGIDSGNFYLFYYPLYEAAEDKIIIDNDARQPLRMYIVKQVDGDPSTHLSDYQLDAAERSYGVTVEMTNLSPTALDDTKIRTNLGMNLVNAAFTGVPAAPVPGQLPTYEVEKVDIPTQVTYKLNGAIRSDLNIFGLSGTRLPGYGTGSDDEIAEVIYDIRISIYKVGAKADGFPDTDRMVVIEGSKNN